MRTLQEWMGHAQLQTTEIYADYAPSSHEKEMVDRAFSPPEADDPAEEEEDIEEQGGDSGFGRSRPGSQ
jgi:hypothetical protein